MFFSWVQYPDEEKGGWPSKLLVIFTTAQSSKSAFVSLFLLNIERTRIVIAYDANLGKGYQRSIVENCATEDP